MDVVTLLFLVLGAVGAGGVVLHYVGYIPAPYRNRLERTEAALTTNLQALPAAIGLEVERALARVSASQDANGGQDPFAPFTSRLDALPSAIGLEISKQVQLLPAAIGVEVEAAFVRIAEKQLQQIGEVQAAAETSAKMSIVRAVGVDKQLAARIDGAMADAIVGPALPILRQFAPGLAELLESNPQAVAAVIDNPLFQRHVMPRIQQFLASRVQGEAATSTIGWGT